MLSVNTLYDLNKSLNVGVWYFPFFFLNISIFSSSDMVMNVDTRQYCSIFEWSTLFCKQEIMNFLFICHKC